MQIFVADGTTLTELLNTLGFSISNLRNSFASNSGCVYGGLPTICYTNIRPCVAIEVDPLTNEILLEAPRNPCLSVFDLAYDGCYQAAKDFGAERFFGSGNYIPVNESLPMTTNWTDPEIRGPFFQQSVYNYIYPNGTSSLVDINCTSPGDNFTVVLSTCTPPLTKDGNRCYIRCPLLPADEDDYDDIFLFEAVMAPIGVFLSGSMLLMTLLNPITRSQILHMAIYFWCLMLGVGLMYPLITGYRYEDILCEGNELVDPTIGDDIKAPKGNILVYTIDLLGFKAGGDEASMTGMLIWMGLIGVLSYSCIILIEGFMKLCLLFDPVTKAVRFLLPNKRVRSKSRPVFVYLLSVLIPIMMSITAASLWAADRFKFTIASTYAFIDQGEEALTISFWVVPVLTMSCVLIICTTLISVMIVVKMIQLRVNLEKMSKFLLSMGITWIYSLICVFLYTGITIYSLYFFDRKDEIETNTSNTYQCVLNSFSLACQDVREVDPYVSLMWFRTAMVCLVPILIPFVWALRLHYWMDHYRFLRRIANAVRTLDPEALLYAVYEGDASTKASRKTMTTTFPVGNDSETPDADEETDEDEAEYELKRRKSQASVGEGGYETDEAHRKSDQSGGEEGKKVNKGREKVMTYSSASSPSSSSSSREDGYEEGEN